MLASVGRYVARHHIGLLALLLVVAGGTAYAAGLAKNSVKSKQIKNGVIKSQDVKDDRLTGADIADGAIGTSELGDGAVTAAKIPNGEIAGTEIAAETLGAGQIKAGAIGSSELGNGAVGTAKLGTGVVTAPKLADGSVTGAKVVDGSIGAQDLDPSTVGDVISSGQTVPMDGAERQLLSIPGFGVLKGTCTSPTNFSMTYTLDSPVTQTAYTLGYDPIDNSPFNGVVFPGTSGDQVVGGNGSALIIGFVSSYTDDRVLTIDIAANSYGGTVCHFRARATVDQNDT